VDVLSEVLREVRLTGALYFDVGAGAPWVATTPGAATICPAIMPGFEHVIAFHIMLEGRAWATLADNSEPSVCLEIGDGVIVARGDCHSMGSEAGRHSLPNPELYHKPIGGTLPYVLREFGGGGERSRFACAFLGCDVRPYNPIIEALPRLLLVKKSSAAGRQAFDLMRTALAESQSPRAGSEAILARTSELMFLHAVRQYIDGLPLESSGWLAALRDVQIGAALRAMHTRPSRQWTLDMLGREVGLSRTAFSERFTALVGMPAMQYLSKWRLQVAGRLLDQQHSNIKQIAADVGYDSQASFNRAFKREVGIPPGAWRRRRSASAS
jgi:AraC-like DNA-binding protein